MPTGTLGYAAAVEAACKERTSDSYDHAICGPNSPCESYVIYGFQNSQEAYDSLMACPSDYASVADPLTAYGPYSLFARGIDVGTACGFEVPIPKRLASAPTCLDSYLIFSAFATACPGMGGTDGGGDTIYSSSTCGATVAPNCEAMALLIMNNSTELAEGLR